MKETRQTIVVAGIGLAAMLLVAAPATAETINYKADLKPSSEVPPNNSAGSGSLTATYDTNTKVLTWTTTYSGLTGPAIMSHFHGPADPGVNAGVVVPLTGSVESPQHGQATLTDAQAAELAAGKWYYNVHTNQNKGGELRGQVVK
ncbi:MAG: CHRD domain-containing protein [Hyphomicrobiales bacterium]|nr:CHRD domain-containing protein [Hyphomicrobiales bacterium]MBV9053078.1 CHRD domain-containing protein [Hyphomicrobiales bacterium]MBV9592055.1 CHRD domain-containing protein [Hyphomicrobiales bacterium]